MKSSLFFTVVESYTGEIEVCSFMGRNRAEEKRFAKSGSKEVHFISTDHDEAQRRAARLRAIPKAERRP